METIADKGKHLVSGSFDAGAMHAVFAAGGIVGKLVDVGDDLACLNRSLQALFNIGLAQGFAHLTRLTYSECMTIDRHDRHDEAGG